MYQKAPRYFDAKGKSLTGTKMETLTIQENRNFPYAEMEGLESELFTKVRKLTGNQKDNPPWTSMKDEKLKG